ncbi:tetraacyldisaccharide 4'-kinase [Vibrio cholerae]|nr:tetraacyldisaccharide 4'-kinase [Vibrio cholerae]
MVIEKIWFHRHPLGYLLWPLLWPFSVLFGVISRSRRKAYQTGDKRNAAKPWLSSGGRFTWLWR